MLLENSPHGASISVYYEANELTSRVLDFIRPLIYNIDPSIQVDVDVNHHDIDLYIGDMDQGPNTYPKDIQDKLYALKFSESTLENFERALQLMCPNRSVSYTYDSNTNGVILEFGGEGSRIIERLNRLYENIDSLNRDETADEIALLIKELNKLKWR